MSDVGPEGRSYRPIDAADLARLAEIARRDREWYFKRRPDWRRHYSRRVLCIALCQGAAKHYVDGKTGINDFDVYTFYQANPRKVWYAKRHRSYDFGDPKFGQSVDRPNFVGRRVDCWGRSIQVQRSEDAVSAICRYLREGRTKTAQLLARKAVVLLEPDLGKVIWPAHQEAKR